MRFPLPLLLVLAALLVSCANEQRMASNTSGSFATLPMSSVYDYESVAQYRFDLEDSPRLDSVRKAGYKAYLDGVDAYANKKITARAIERLKQSLCLYPTPGAYFMLGKALTDTRAFADAQKALKLSEELHYDGKGELAYAQARLLALTDSAHEVIDWGIRDNLSKSVRDGYLTQEAFETDNVFDWVRQHPNFQDQFRDLFPEAEVADSLRFQRFLAAFPEGKGWDLALEPDSASKVYPLKEIPYSYAPYIREMETTRYGRDVSNVYRFYARVDQTPAYTAVIFVNQSNWGNMLFTEAHYNLATYSPGGQLIDQREIGCSCALDKVKTFELSADGGILVREIELKYKKPLKDAMPDELDNPIVGHQALSENRLHLSADGHILAAVAQ